MQIRLFVEDGQLFVVKGDDMDGAQRYDLTDLEEHTREEPLQVTFDPKEQADIAATPEDMRPLGQRSQAEQDRVRSQGLERIKAERATQEQQDAGAVAEQGLDNPTRTETDGVREQRTRPAREAVQEQRDQLEREEQERQQEEGQGEGNGREPAAGGTFVDQPLGETVQEPEKEGSTQTGSRFGSKGKGKK